MRVLIETGTLPVVFDEQRHPCVFLDDGDLNVLRMGVLVKERNRDGQGPPLGETAGRIVVEATVDQSKAKDSRHRL